MPAIGAGTGELAQFVADHVFVHENWDMLATVMYRDGQTDHCGRIIERRDQVLTGLRSFFSTATSIFFRR
ncbi:hypothetical protein VM57_03485 [Stenotrophomonas maltophilia]|uniref:Uncharacterized protein n=1 Tax=Stenotrophomonas maltophilia TaxID=40324 RepID=A0A0F5ZQN5_STEMA|nr:hypothetical protein VM57_03485 [Stenotrophomonas maltophilia]